MKRILILAAACLAAFGCNINISFPLNVVVGNGIETVKSYDLSGFDAISAAGSMDVVYSQCQDSSSVVLTADENLIDIFEVRVEEGTLKFSTKKGTSVRSKVHPVLRVCSPAVNAINLSGSGDCEIRDELLAPGAFSFRASGSGDLNACKICCTDFSAKISGSGSIAVSDLTVNSASAAISGSGDIAFGAVTAESISIGISGSGDAVVGCRNAGDIDIRISGSGDIRLTGTARSLKKRISGSGSIHASSLTLSE